MTLLPNSTSIDARGAHKGRLEYDCSISDQANMDSALILLFFTVARRGSKGAFKRNRKCHCSSENNGVLIDIDFFFNSRLLSSTQPTLTIHDTSGVTIRLGYPETMDATPCHPNSS